MTETRTDTLLEILLDLLAPLLLTETVTDIKRARLAARQAIEEYCARSPAEYVVIGQIVAFAVSALDNLRLSMASDLTLSMKLRLRGNASALSRASLHATKTLDRVRQVAESLVAEWEDDAEPPQAEALIPEPVPATLPAGEQSRRHWANAMASVATRLRARADKVPQAQRKSDRLWVDVLTNVAGELRQPNRAPLHPGLSKANLFRTTLMTGGGFPAHLLAETPKPSAG